MKRHFRHLAGLAIAATVTVGTCEAIWSFADRSPDVAAATDSPVESKTRTTSLLAGSADTEIAATEPDRKNQSAPNISDSTEPKNDDKDVTYVQVVTNSNAKKPDSPQAGKEEVELRLSSEAQLAKGEINFDDLKFDIEKDSIFDAKMWTPRLKKISGKKVKLSGYILPSTLFQEKGIKQFILVRDNQECCFGPGAALYDCVVVNMVDGASTDFTTRPVTVEGKFHLDDKTYRHPGGKGPGGSSHMAVFRIDGMKVK